jgi:Cytochrome C'
MMRLVRVVLVVVTGTCLAAGCGTPAPVEQQQAAPAAAPAQPSATSPVSINASMVSIVDHAGHQLWNVEREGNKPKTKEDWEVLAEHATQLAAAGALVRIPGTGVQDMTWVASPDWQKWARAMSDAAQAQLKATEGENFEALVAANGQLVETCEGCHKQFKPELPSEGIAHAHAH